MSQELVSINESLLHQGMFSTVKGTDTDSKIKVFNAVNSATQISALMEKSKGTPVKIKIADIIIQRVDVTNDQTGEVEEAPRVIFINDEGKAFSATSKGLLSSVRNIIGILGEPSTWDNAIEFVVVEKRGRNGFRYMTMEIA